MTDLWPWVKHLRHVCVYHANPDNHRTDPDYAMKLLASCVANGLVTQEEAAQIREECGWMVQREMAI